MPGLPMKRPARVLVVDDLLGALSRALGAVLAGHEIEIAPDAIDAIHRIDCAVRPHDVIFCAVEGGDLTGPELRAYLAIDRIRAARRLVFVALRPPKAEVRALLPRFENPYVELPRERATRGREAPTRHGRTRHAARP